MGQAVRRKRPGRCFRTSRASRILKKGDWNHYEIEAIGSHIRTWLNGQPCVDFNDPSGKSRGLFALQLHAGGPTEVRFRNIKLEVR